MRSLVFLAAVALMGLVLVQADLPIHCLHTQIVGEWTFSLSKDDHQHPYLCGYRTPDKNKYHFDGSKRLKTEYTTLKSVAKTLTVSLVEPNRVEANGKSVGKWTMVYDEGFHVTMDDGQAFFAFMKYTPKKGTLLSDLHQRNYNSECGKTLVGWFHGKNNKQWGCWTGVQTKPKYSNINNTIVGGKNDLWVVAPKKSSLLETASQTQTTTASKIFDNEVEYTEVEDPHAAPEYLSAMYTPDFSLIDQINNDVESLWSAKAHEHFMGKTNEEMLKMAGSSTFGKSMLKSHSRNAAAMAQAAALGQSKSKLDKIKTDVDSSDSDSDSDSDSESASSRSQNLDELNVHGDIKSWMAKQPKGSHGFPKNLDWRNVDGKSWVNSVRNQGSCGSCYTMAVMAAMESRIRISTNEKGLKENDFVSPQYVLSCSVYNQGCDGGYPFLVGKHSEDFGALLETNLTYEASDGVCSSKGTKNYPIKNTRYVGGFYGGCNEAAMLREIQEGPIAVAYENPPALFSYHGGIFTGPRPRGTDMPQSKLLNRWEHTNHAVVAVGYGEEKVNGKSEKYWIIRNSWGKMWGEKGYFRIRRGTNECGIESMAVSFDVNPNVIMK